MKQGPLTQPPQIIWIFDVDGVITNPREKKVTQQGLIEAIAHRLDIKDIVTLNTGRSIPWMMHRVIIPIENTVKDKSSLTNFLAIGEKGGSWLSFHDGKWETQIDENITTPKALQSIIKDLITAEYSDCMFYDESKLTMISTEMIDGQSVDNYSKKQAELVKKLENILTKPEFQPLGFQVDPTIIATDIQNRQVGKHFGARKIANWLEKKHIAPSQVITIGDSQSDIEMAEELQDEYPTTFVFVGNPAKIKMGKFKKDPIITSARYEQGTMEFLKSFTK